MICLFIALLFFTTPIIPAGHISKNLDRASFEMTFPDSNWIEVVKLDSTIVLDMRYATDNNFVEVVLYDCARCYLNHSVAQEIVKVHRTLRSQGLGLKLFDCYRPLIVQEKLWSIMPNASYVTPPARGSMHSRGLAVDATIVDQMGNELDMGTDFDFFGRKAHQDNFDLPQSILENRTLLRSTMEEFGFRSIRTEWWHYSYSLPGQKIAEWKWDCG
jgi:D-alanyl-D-alanine dipeptidase